MVLSYNQLSCRSLIWQVLIIQVFNEWRHISCAYVTLLWRNRREVNSDGKQRRYKLALILDNVNVDKNHVLNMF